MSGPTEQPWWASRSDHERIDDADPLGAHRRARRGAPPDGEAGAGADWLGEAVEVLAGLATQAGRRMGEHVAPHDDGQVCDACPICIGLRALRQVRPEVIGHLSDAAHHLSLALRAVAEAQAGEGDVGLTHIDLDP